VDGMKHVKVVTKEEFKKFDIERVTGIVVDEAHHFASPLFSKGRSQLAEKMYCFVKSKPQAPVLLLTATPIRSQPWNIHTLLTYIGIYIPMDQFRRDFYMLINRPYLPRPAWEPKPDWRKKARALVEKYALSARLVDIVESVPEQHEETVVVELDGDVAQQIEDVADENPSAEWFAKHRLQNGMDKVVAIKDIAGGFRKVIVVCRYREQLALYAEELGKEREVFELHGGTKDTNAVQESSECYFLIQADCGAGFDADTFACMIFASMSFSYVSLVQMKGRINRIHNLHPNWYYYLTAGEEDERVVEILQSGRDFDINTDI
jgi:SNF2-related domain